MAYMERDFDENLAARSRRRKASATF